MHFFLRIVLLLLTTIAFSSNIWSETDDTPLLQPVETPRDISFTRLKAKATSQHAPGSAYNAAANVVDGFVHRLWESERGSLKKGPQSVTIEMDAVYTVDALRYFYPGTDRIYSYQIQISLDGKEFTTVADGKWDPKSQAEERVGFAPTPARFVRLVAFSGGNYTARAREITLESPNPPPPKGEVVIPPPKNTEARRNGFAERQSPEQLKKLAEQLFRFVNRTTPAMRGVVECQQKGDAEGALRAFNRAFAARLIERQALISNPRFLTPSSPRLATLLQANILKALNKPVYIEVSEPGTIDWDSPELTARTRLTYDLFEELLTRYDETGDSKYLVKWAAFIDDMIMNYHQREELRPFEIKNDDAHVNTLCNLFYRLMILEKKRPGILEALPIGTLPRLMMKIIPVDIALSSTFSRSYPGNWYPGYGEKMVQLGLILDDLIGMDVPLLQRGLDAFGLYGVRENFPDGTDIEASLGYNGMFMISAVIALDWIKTVGVNSGAPQERQQELRDDVIRRSRWRTLSLTYDCQQPLVLRQDGRKWSVKAAVADDMSASLDGSELGGLAESFFPDRLVAQALAAHEPNAKAGLASIFFAWGGYGIIREGWTPDSQYGFMMSRPYISHFGTRGVTDNLNLGIHAFGADLLVDGVFTLYARSTSQLRVDGRNQYFIVDSKDPSAPLTRQYLTDAWEKPSPVRWLHSESFDFMEGTYSGPYGSKNDPAPVTDTTHQRQVVFVRAAGLWLVIDRLSAGQPRNFTWHWMLPCSDKKESILTFRPDTRRRDPKGTAKERDVVQPDKTGEISIDASQYRIFTAKPDSANLTLQTFTNAPLNYSCKNRLVAKAPSGKVCMIDATAQPLQEALALTVILPRRAMSDDLREVKRFADDTSEGFSVIAPNGAVVRCQAARKGLSTLKSGNVTAQAELLVTVEKDGQFSGLTLGCTTLNKSNKKETIPFRDFVFDMKKDDPQNTKTDFIPILSAINPVEILPSCNIFCDSELITLSCTAPDVEIRYTIDSSEPIRSSQLYTKPFSIRESTRIRARAFRICRQESVGTMDFTLDSAESSAFYERQSLLPPHAESTKTNPGLRYQYYEGNWQQLYLNPALAEPVASGTVPNLFDLGALKTVGPFTFIYDGFLEVPKDGVYTFHAPLELIDNRLIDAGYELVLYVGDRRWQPAMRRHAFGSWSVALKKGLHSFRLKYLDYRGNLVVGYNTKGERQEVKIDHAAWQKQFGYTEMLRPLDTARRACDFVWVGPPRLELSGPGLERGPIPSVWFFHQ